MHNTKLTNIFFSFLVLKIRFLIGHSVTSMINSIACEYLVVDKCHFECHAMLF